MSFYRAKSLDVLLAEVNKHAPDRDKASDGWVGDTSHSARKSDHNPDYSRDGVVRAMDIDHDPAGKCDAGVIANRVAKMLGKHPALGSGAYVIYNRRIISTDRLSESWRPYDGVNAHTLHVHISVGQKGYDSTAKWGVFSVVAKAKAVVRYPISLAAARKQATANKPRKRDSVRRIQKGLNRWSSSPYVLVADGVWGPKTWTKYKRFQKSLGLRVTGVPAAKSLAVLASKHGRYRVVK